MAFDPRQRQGLGPTVGKRVKRLFRNVADTIIDLRGLRMTPGHVVLSDNGDWLTIAGVLKADRAIVEEREGRPVPVRARTGQPVGGVNDIAINVVFADSATGGARTARVRAGIPAVGGVVDGARQLWTLGRVLHVQGYCLAEDDTLLDGHGRRFNATPWPGGTPFDAAICDDWILSVDGQPYTPQWIADLPLEDSVSHAMNDSERRPADRQRSGPIRTSTDAGSKTPNRHERRRASSLHAVK